MPICQNCSAPLDENSKFCPQCGTPVPSAEPLPQPESVHAPQEEEPVFCPQCGTKNRPDASFCRNCGASLQEVEMVVQPVDLQTVQVPQQEYRKSDFIKSVFSPFAVKGKKLPVKITAGILAAVIVVVAVVAINPFGKKAVPVFYRKDNELNYILPSNKSKPVEFTDNYGSDSALQSLVNLSGDGKRLFYPDKLSGDSFSLYYRNVNGKDEDGEKIDSDVTDYQLLQNDTLLLYKKSADNSLYLNDLKDKTKIDTDVVRYEYSNSKKQIVYTTSDKELYVRGLGAKDEKEKISGSVDEFYISGDFSRVYYVSDGSLYVQEFGKDKKKITSDLGSILSCSNDGKVQYLKKTTKKVNAADYVNDDMESQDASITEPNISDYTTARQDMWGYSYENTDYDRYYADMDRYNQKVSRDNLREALKSDTIELESNTLCYYDGTNSSNISENVCEDVDRNVNPLMTLYTKYEDKNVEKVNLSEADSAAAVEDAVRSSHAASSEYYLAVGGKETQLKQDKAADFCFYNTSLYYIDNLSSDNTGTLMKIDIKDNTVGSPQKIDDDVAGNTYIYDVGDNKIAYCKDVSNQSYELYQNKEKIASDVYGFYYNKDDKSFYLVTDYSKNDGMGTLSRWANGKSEKVADSIRDFQVLSNQNVAYISDYSGSTGTLLLKSGSKEPQKLDEDVTGLIFSDFYNEVSNNG
jgi:Primosomal protein N'' (replication factor Y) - superfamily II helicase